MRWRTRGLMVAMSLLVVAPTMTRAAIEEDEIVALSFDASCPPSRGYIFRWNADLEPDFEAALGSSELSPVDWSPQRPITYSWFAGAVLGQRYVFVLVGADGQTVLFERDFEVRTATKTQDRYFALTATLSCSTTPFREVAMPDTRTGMADQYRNPLTILGSLVLLVAGFASWSAHRSRGRRVP